MEEIDAINILQATLKAMTAVSRALHKGTPDFTLVDGNRLPKACDELPGCPGAWRAGLALP